MFYKFYIKVTIWLFSQKRPLMSVVFPNLPVPEIMFPRHGEQCPIVELSYMGYSPPKCTCNDNQTHSSKYMILLEFLHDMGENTTHPFPLLEPSLTSSRMPKPNVRKTLFSKQKVFVLKNILLSFSKIYWTTLQGEFVG